MPCTKHYNLCSALYSLAQELFGFNCPVPMARSVALHVVHCVAFSLLVQTTIVLALSAFFYQTVKCS